MNIQKQHFGLHIVKFLQDVAESHFVAFDLEFSGIPDRNRDRSSKPSLQENYVELRQAVQEYQILQIGLTLVKFNEGDGRYIAQPYNFTISPLPELRERQFKRKWSMNSGAVSFLQRHGFDFGAWITHGVHYLSREEEAQSRATMAAEASRQDMALKPEDEPLVKHIRKSIAEWQAHAKAEQENYLNIPNGTEKGIPQQLNRYQMRLTHQIVQNEYPGLVTRGMAHFVQVTNPSEEQQANAKRLEALQRERDLLRAVGFRWILEGLAGNDISDLPHEYIIPALAQDTQAAEGEAPVLHLLQTLGRELRERRKILIGHNCLTDLMYLYKMIIGDLPVDIYEFTDNLHELFPAIVDTKFLASCYSEKYGRSMLGDVELELRSESFPQIICPAEFERYMDSAYYHEAGYDSYITAIVAIKLSAKLHREGPKWKGSREKEDKKAADFASSSHPEFGIEEGYITAAESDSSGAGSMSNNRATALTKPVAAIKSLLAPNTNASSIEEETFKKASAPEVVAVKEISASSQPRGSITINRKDEAAIDRVRSAFASTSLYDKLESGDDTTMPGDEEPTSDAAQPVKKKKPKKRDLNKLVESGEVMPRWHEEGAFWDFYGNKLQVNGTIEGVLKLA